MDEKKKEGASRRDFLKLAGTSAPAAVAVAAGDRHSCAIQAGSGNVICWGSNTWGQTNVPSTVNGTAGLRALCLPAATTAVQSRREPAA